MSNEVETVHHIKQVNLDVLRLESGIYVLCVGVRSTCDIGRAQHLQSKLKTSSKTPHWLSLSVKEEERWARSIEERYDCIGYISLDWFYEVHCVGDMFVHFIRKLGVENKQVMLGTIGWLFIEKEIVKVFGE